MQGKYRQRSNSAEAGLYIRGIPAGRPLDSSRIRSYNLTRLTKKSNRLHL